MEIISETNWTRWTQVDDPKFHQFWFEKVDLNFWYDFADSYIIPLVTSGLILYLSVVWSLKQFMKGREPYQSLRVPLFLWNSTVGIFSFIAFIRISTEVLYLLQQPQGFYRSICLREGLHMSTIYWSIIIVLTKPLFALDTIFLLLRKKPVDIFHLLHHSLAIFFAPLLLSISEPVLRWIGVANLLVHCIDYHLLALKSLQFPVPKSRQIMVGLEIFQMMFVLFLSVYTMFLKETGRFCLRHPKSEMMIYGIYFGLLVLIALTILSPEYWQRGTRKKKDSPTSRSYPATG